VLRCVHPAQPGVILPAAETHTISSSPGPLLPAPCFPCSRGGSRLGMPSTAEYMSIAETMTRFFSSRSRNRKGWNIGGVAAASSRVGCGLALSREPDVDLAHELRVAQAQVVVRDPAAPRQEVERELHRILVDVLSEILEPFEARLRSSLSRHNHRLCAPPRMPRAPAPRSRSRAGTRRARARPPWRASYPTRSKVRGVRGITEDHDVAVMPALVAHCGETDPPRVVRMHRVGRRGLARTAAVSPQWRRYRSHPDRTRGRRAARNRRRARPRRSSRR